MRYMTIEREYGSGGTKIARQLAKETNIPCYGEEILQRASELMNMPIEQIRECEEKATNSLLYSIYMFSQAQSRDRDMLAKEGKVFVEEQKAILEFASKGSAIFLGHCASEALKEYDDVISVFIYADKEFKRERIRTDYGIAEDKIDAVERKNNKRRANYYSVNTQNKWSDLRNYDIVLNSSKLGIDECVNALKNILN